MAFRHPSTLSPLALVVLALLDEAPMYPYRMQQLIRERGNDQLVNIRNRASLYQTITRLDRDGLIEVQGVAKTEHRPERTTYQLTELGRTTLHSWLREMLGTRAAEFPEFPVALSFVYLLEPEVALEELTRRRAALEAAQLRLAGMLAEHSGAVPRLFLLESEYLNAIAEAELAWLRGIAADLGTGRLGWNTAAIRAQYADTGESGS
ncbi:MAG: PadR family transcriptional regulator [Gemmatimonadota bacterium]